MHTGLLAADAWKRERKKPRLKKERCKPEQGGGCREGEILYQLSKCKRSQKTNQSMSNYQDNWNRSQVNEESAENGCC